MSVQKEKGEDSDEEHHYSHHQGNGFFSGRPSYLHNGEILLCPPNDALLCQGRNGVSADSFLSLEDGWGHGGGSEWRESRLVVALMVTSGRKWRGVVGSSQRANQSSSRRDRILKDESVRGRCEPEQIRE